MTATASSPSATPINTGKTKDRRSLRFNTFEELWSDVERVVASEREGTLRRSGNWTVGQNFGHLAAFINYAYDGYPNRPSIVIKLLLRPMKNRFLNKSLPSGVKIPGAKGGTWGHEPRSTDDGYTALKNAWSRLRAAAPSKPNPIFGVLSHDEWMQMHLRHAELHLSFLHPQ